MIRDSISLATRRAYSGEYELEMGKAHGVCLVKSCGRLVLIRTRHNRPHVPSLCQLHAKRLWRKRHPELAQYQRLKAKAKKRKKPFDITKAEWVELCRLTCYHEGTASRCGSVAEGLTIDRINHKKGYTLDNIRVIVHRLNAGKGAAEMTSRLASGRYTQLRLGSVSVAEQLSEEAKMEQLIESL